MQIIVLSLSPATLRLTGIGCERKEAMARSTAVSTRASAEQLRKGPGPVIRRPRPAHGLELAQRTFLACERVEMGALAAELDVSQATIYRWFGSREQLLEQVIDRTAREFLAVTRAEATGKGDARVLDFVRRFMEVTVTLDSVQAFVEREPQLALRLLLGEGGVIRSTLRDAVAEVVAETRSPEEAQALESEFDVIVEIGVALEWATFAIGDKPRIDHAIHVIGMLLAAHRAGLEPVRS